MEVEPLQRYIGCIGHGYKRFTQHVQLNGFIPNPISHMQVQLVGLLAVDQRSVNIVLACGIQLAQQIISIKSAAG